MPELRPLLGITACTRAVGDEMGQVVIDRYIGAAMRHADVAALLVPARPDLMTPVEAAARLDGVLLTGSPSNVAPERYGDIDGDGPFDAGRDAMSMGLIEAMIARGKPVFGICRGFQEVNVAFGGSLDRGVGTGGRGLDHHAPADVDLDATFGHVHEVTLSTGGILARATQQERLRVNSVHYQGVARLGDDLTIEAVADDGVIEAVAARPNGAQVLAVQWHPEWATEHDPASIIFFKLLGQAMRGERLS